MSYKALKRCRFDRVYSAGEIISDGAVDETMVKKLKGMKIIEEVTAAAEKPTAASESLVEATSPEEDETTSEEQENAAEKPTAAVKRGRKPKAG